MSEYRRLEPEVTASKRAARGPFSSLQDRQQRSMDSLIDRYESMPGGNNTLGVMPKQAGAPKAVATPTDVRRARMAKLVPSEQRRFPEPTPEPDVTLATVGGNNVIGANPDTIADREKFAKAREARDQRKELARQRQFARAQMRRGTMLNEDGTADLTGSMAARLMGVRPEVAAALTMGRDNNRLAQDRMQALIDQQAVENQMAERRFTREGEQMDFRNTMDRDRFDAERKERRAMLELKKREVDEAVKNGEITREQAVAEKRNLEAQTAREEQQMAFAQAQHDQTQAAIEESGGMLGYMRALREAQEGPLDEESPADVLDRQSQFLARPEEVKKNAFDILMSKPPEERQGYMDKIGMPVSFIEDMQDNWKYSDYMEPLTRGLLFDTQAVADRRKRQAEQAASFMQTYGAPTRDATR